MEFTQISNLEIALGSLAIIAYFYLGLAVYLRDSQSWTNRLFLLFIIVLIAYTIVNPISLHPVPPTQEGQLFWIRIVIFVASFIGPILFLLVHTFPRKEITLQSKYLAMVLAMALTSAVASLTPLIFKSISYPGGQPVPSPGKGIFLFVLNFPVMVFMAFGLLIKRYRRAAGEEKAKLFYFLSGVTATFSLMVFLTIALVVIFKTPAGVFFGPISPLILTGFIAYAIVKHKFMDIQPIIARAVSFFLVLFIFAAAYTALIIFIVGQFFTDTRALVILFWPVLIGMLLFQPLEQIMRRVTDRIFFKGRYNKDQLLSLITHIMAETIDLDPLTIKVLKVLTGGMKISKGAFLIIDNHRIVGVHEIGFRNQRLQASDLENLFHKESPGLVRNFILEELEEGAIKKAFRQHDISVAIPIKVEKTEVAVLVLGPKLSGERYHPRDIDFLIILAAELGVAIQNAKSFKEIKKFSKELEKRVEERTRELRETQERELSKAKEVARLKDEFVFVAAHELRTPMTAIDGFLELVFESMRVFPKDVKKHLEAISAASTQINQLIDDLLEIARSEAGVMKISVAPIDVAAIINSVTKELEPLAKKKKIKFVAKFPEIVPKALGDVEKVKEVITNLISNAIKYNRTGGKVEINMIFESDDLIVEFNDTGYGITLGEQDKIFQKFFRANTEEARGVSGTGLGLFITRMLVEKMGGKIMFSSVEGSGSTFAFSLKFAEK